MLGCCVTARLKNPDTSKNKATGADGATAIALLLLLLQLLLPPPTPPICASMGNAACEYIQVETAADEPEVEEEDEDDEDDDDDVR